MSLERAFAGVAPLVASTLEACLSGRELDVAGALVLANARGADLRALVATADALRREQVGDVVGYVVNRNLNFTNVCVKACKFCAFSRTIRSTEGYFLDEDEIARRVVEARDYGATEVCIQAGLAPGMAPDFYARLCRVAKRAAPEVHLHAFSPEEIKYAVVLAGKPVREVLLELREAGLGSLPGTSAEILDDRVRARIAAGRITTREWIDVVTTAHALGIPTTSTIMFGHVETLEERFRHVELLRSIQRETRGFTEFVPLSFVHEEAPMTVRQSVPELRAGPTGAEVVRFFAISRLMLGRAIPNLQVSWVKEGLRNAQTILDAGANDLGGTLMNESISTSAGASYGQLTKPRELRRVVRDLGRVPVQRDTSYRPLREFHPSDASSDPVEPLDAVDDAEATFGSYDELARDARFRFRLDVVDA